MGSDARPLSATSLRIRSHDDEGDWLDTDGESYELLAPDEGWPGPYGAASRGAP